MIEMSPNLLAKWGKSQGLVAKYLQGLVVEQATEGWEFQRIDTFTMTEQAGCGCASFLARAFLGQPSERTFTVYVATFRMPLAQVPSVAKADAPPT